VTVRLREIRMRATKDRSLPLGALLHRCRKTSVWIGSPGTCPMRFRVQSTPRRPILIAAPSRIPLQPGSKILLGQRTVGHCNKRSDLFSLRRFELLPIQI
jgi:hypothetical protein